MALRSTDTETRKTISTRCKKIRCERLQQLTRSTSILIRGTIFLAPSLLLTRLSKGSRRRRIVRLVGSARADSISLVREPTGMSTLKSRIRPKWTPYVILKSNSRPRQSDSFRVVDADPKTKESRYSCRELTTHRRHSRTLTLSKPCLPQGIA